MAEDNSILSRKTLRSSYISSIISISLVLFLLGILGVLILQANAVAGFVKENFQVTLILKDDVEQNTIDSIQNILKKKEMVRECHIITKEEAAKKLQADLGEDFVSFLGYNPLNSSIDVSFKAEYVNDSLFPRIEKTANDLHYVKEVYYQKSLVEKINSNLRTISFVILGFSALLLFVAIILINNTIRINLYAKRMLIRSMQLVGATRNFIRWPFLLNAMLHGLYSAIIGGLLVYGLVYLIRTNFGDLDLIVANDAKMWFTLFGGLVLTGVFISLISTYFAVNKWLGKRAHELF
ncbi:MAG: permease-like cell division protein FtsX [Bacteroidia bacterium]